MVLGLPIMGFGFWGMFHDGARTHPADAFRWLVGSAVVHDLVALPLVLVFSALIARPLPAWVRPPVRAGLAASAILAVVAWPEVAGYGEDPAIPSLLPRDELTGLLAYLGVVWLVVSLTLVLMGLARRRRPAPGAPRSAGT